MIYDVVIVGAGPAGLSAAIYVQRAGKKALVFEGNMYGGQIVNTPEIENYPGIQKISGFEFAEGLYNQATSLGAEVVFEKAETISKREAANEVEPGSEDGEKSDFGFFVTTNSGKAYQCKAVILATGAVNRKLGLAKEDTLLGGGISYCATCDGAFYKGKAVAVAGGGNTALEDAKFLSNYCSKVYLIHRRDTFRGAETSVMQLRNKENVEFVLDSVITELLSEVPETAGNGIAVTGKTGIAAKREKLSGVVVKNRTSNEERTLPVSGLFVAVGQEPVNERFRDIVSLDASGYIAADESCATNTPGVFTAGDCRTKKVRQLTTAAADGAVAALAAVEFIG